MTEHEKDILLHTLKAITIEQAKYSQRISTLLDELYNTLCEGKQDKIDLSKKECDTA